MISSKKLNGSTMFYSFTYALEPVVMELWAVPPVEQEAYYSMVMVGQVYFYPGVVLHSILSGKIEKKIHVNNKNLNVNTISKKYCVTYALEPVVMELWVVPQPVPVVYYSMVMVGQVDLVCFYQAVPVVCLPVPVVLLILKNRN